MNLVTGATGILGTHILIELLRRGEPVRALRRAQSNLTIVKQIFDFYGAPDFQHIEWVEADVLDIPSLLDAAQGCSRIFHCAAMVSYHAADKEKMYTINIEGTENVINTALHLGGIKVAFISSTSAIGKAKNNDVVDEESEWVDNAMNTNYAISKQRSEMEFWRGIHEGMQGLSFNPGIIIGPGDFTRSSPTLFKKINEGLSYYPPGGTGFISAVDCARVIVELTLSDVNGERFILVSENLSMKEVFQEIAAVLGKKTPSRQANPWILELARIAEAIAEKITRRKALITRETVRNASLRFYYDNDKVKRACALDFTPIKEAIAQTAAYFKKHESTASDRN